MMELGKKSIADPIYAIYCMHFFAKLANEVSLQVFDLVARFDPPIIVQSRS